MAFFDQLKGSCKMTEEDQIKMAEDIFNHIKTCCITRKNMGLRNFVQVLAWNYMEFQEWQYAKSGFVFTALGNPEEELPSYKDDFAECTKENRDAILRFTLYGVCRRKRGARRRCPCR